MKVVPDAPLRHVFTTGECQKGEHESHLGQNDVP